MKERPILFSAPMVRALLSGTKTQTRRVVKPLDKHHPVVNLRDFDEGFSGRFNDPDSWGYAYAEDGNHMPLSYWAQLCPYGQPGGRLWVRETFVLENTSEYHGDHDVPTDDRPIKKFEDGDGNWWLIPHYRASEPEPHIVPYSAALEDENDDRTRWTPAIHMPRWASRITLEITGVRVERLQDISRGDAMDEGCPFPNMAQGDDPRQWYAELWGQINGPGSWETNPWVWVIEFKAIKP